MTTYDDLVVALRGNGYSRSTAADRWGIETWSRKGCPALRVPSECSATAAERVLVQADHDLVALASKRKPKKFRARETAARKAEALNRRRLEIEAHIAARNRELGGLREHLTSKEARDIQLVIERHERELRELRRLMTEIPSPNAHAGRVQAQHRS